MERQMNRYQLAIGTATEAPMFEKGMKVIIDGEIVYGQDFSWWQGTFPEVIFTVDALWEDKIRLRAPGYGDLEQGYGNGAIYVYKKHFFRLKPV